MRTPGNVLTPHSHVGRTAMQADAASAEMLSCLYQGMTV